MAVKRIASIVIGIGLSAILLTGSAFAFCGVLRASATGYSREEAINTANNKGLVEVRKLERSYGSENLQFYPATSTCQEGGRVSCAITQKFCANGGGRSRPGRGEEGREMHGCPPGTRQVPETDNCVPVRRRAAEFEKDPWKKPGCNGWKQRCDRGDARACGKYESTCQVN